MAGTTQPDSIKLEIIDLNYYLAVKKYYLGCVSRLKWQFNSLMKESTEVLNPHRYAWFTFMSNVLY